MTESSLFEVVNIIPRPRGSRWKFILLRDDWDDMFKFETTFLLFFEGEHSKRVQIGKVKIGTKGLTPQERKPPIPDNFDSLDDRFFSIGQDENYYDTLTALPGGIGITALKGLRDAALDLTIFEDTRNEEVMRVSLMRTVSQERITSRFHNLAHGRVQLTPFSFFYQFSADTDEPLIRFNVVPESLPPTNIHVLIGRNGVGKTRLLDRFTRALLGIETSDKDSPAGVGFDDEEANGTFVNVISVSFSAFDPFGPIPPNEIPAKGISYAYIGLKRERTDPEQPYELKGRADLQAEFVRAVQACRIGARVNRWRQAIKTLESDPLFEAIAVSQLVDKDDEFIIQIAERLFDKLSSGHGIVLLTITRLVELVDERSLVLLDEPEGHLHPPLLSAFIRALSELLTQRNGVAVIATHSPVVLQEVPSPCVSTLSRYRDEIRVDRPEIETFGENVGILTREVFGLEVQQSGFHTLLAKAIKRNNGDFDAAIASFGEHLGAEARAIARGMALTYDPDEGL